MEGKDNLDKAEKEKSHGVEEIADSGGDGNGEFTFCVCVCPGTRFG